MLEVLNLTKIYKTKKGADVHALDGVSLRFAEKGMVFLLGKSGSGKSTLLNVCGGLDSPTSGEIIVKGRSSKNFSQSDFDSYRNTFIGFIFQEYNILNEFTVEDNIALALELQGKSKDKAAINALLEQVDLVGLAKRKPNTLSGGQKQRIAIARALIKSPEIIMADEPTGALDSNTGRQVFETLKKLSRDKLVIVVSHDREFAELYGDRIIELKDGKVLSDVSKTQQETSEISENISAIGDILCVKNGSELSDGEFDKIKAYLKKSKSDVIIANGEDDIKSFKKATRITDNGSREVFAKTDSEKMPKRQYKPEESRFIRSKLPARHAIKIGVSGIKNKPVRLFFTVILCTIAFVLFGLLSTVSFYNSEATFKESLANSNKTVMLAEKGYKVHQITYRNGKVTGEYDFTNIASLSDKDIENLRELYGDDVFGAVNVNTNFSVRNVKSSYYVTTINRMAYLPEGNSYRERINGAYPKNDNEIVISSYSADVMKECGVYNSEGEALELEKATDIIGKKISIGGFDYTVTGIFDSGVLESRFDAIKNGNQNMLSQYDFTGTLDDGFHLMAFVSDSRIQNMLGGNQYNYYSGKEFNRAKGYVGEGNFEEYPNVVYSGEANYGNSNKIYALNGEKKALADNEVYVSSMFFVDSISSQINELQKDMYETKSESEIRYIENLNNAIYELREGGVYKENGKEMKLVPLTEAQTKARISTLSSAISKYNLNTDFTFRAYDEYNGVELGEVENYKVAGIIIEPQNYEFTAVFSESTFGRISDLVKSNALFYIETKTNYVADEKASYGVALLPFDKSEELTNKYWELYGNADFDSNDSCIKLTGMFVSKLKTVDDFVETGSKVFLYVGLAFALFAILLFSNFISVSISQKKREIGILRAVGARSLDVFKIFFSESFVIAAICVALASVGTTLLCGYINSELSEGLGVSLFVFGPFSLAVLIAIALITAVVATFLPVNNAARKKPVESIRAL